MDKFTLYDQDAVLLIIDIQERLVPAVFSGARIVAKVSMLATIAARLEILVLVTEQYPKGLGKTVPKIGDKLAEATVLEKTAFSAYTPDMASLLERTGRKKLVVTGMETHVCVFQTVRDLLAHGFQVFVAEDGVGSRTEENKRNGLALMAEMGAVITNAETVFFDLLKEAGTPLFKELAKVVK